MIKITKRGSKKQIQAKIKELESQMREAARQFDFEKAAEIRDIILEMRASING